MEIDPNAPISAAGGIDVGASPLDVWTVLTDVAGWPHWNPDVSDARLEGPLAPGTTFRWKAGPGTITSVVRSVEPLRELGWTGTTMGIRAVHVWRLEQTAAGSRLSTMESWRGWPVRLLRGRMEARLREAVDSGLRHLKAEVERRVAAQLEQAA